ncbi:E3 ubiquitin-protein ligase RFWD3-like [Drosophila obscura]|uniref:E3 ubiquitin-protein ligase RFWD3-like n=1 Tax=Drosophila obscura TaxID=7282 RepID=UPI001BB1311E|nr:E3 ubiquitin-protein ligase RFWD3-like [Drosophila obscura]
MIRNVPNANNGKQDPPMPALVYTQPQLPHGNRSAAQPLRQGSIHRMNRPALIDELKKERQLNDTLNYKLSLLRNSNNSLCVERSELVHRIQAEVSKVEKLRKTLDEQGKALETALQTVQTLKRQNANQNTAIDKDCCICFLAWEPSGPHRLVSLLCGHLFGDACIREYLSQKHDCPTCRQGAYVEQIRYLYPQ